MQSVSQWAQQNFGQCNLGDKRRTDRLVKVAEDIGNNPSGSLPNKIERWSDLKAAYRLFDCKQATFNAIASGHWNLTKSKARGRVLVIADTTELNFGSARKIEGVGPTGGGHGQGFLLHNALMVQADTSEILGLAGQTIHYRQKKRRSAKPESAFKRMKRKRESEVWGTVIEQVGQPAEGTQYVHIFDRGGDNFEAYCHLLDHGGQWLIRASKLNRRVLDENDEPKQLRDCLPSFKELGEYTLEVCESRNKKKGVQRTARLAELTVRSGCVKIPAPRVTSPWVRQRGQSPIEMNVIEVLESCPPENTTPIHWVLFTSLPVETYDQAWELLEYYEQRWLIEEFHKALKTGCKSEASQLKTGGRLEAFIGVTSVVAIRLLQLKSLARTKPDIQAKRVVPKIWLDMLKLARKKTKRVHDLTVGQFYREVAMLGGFLARKSDGNPGWLTLWRGWEKLNTYVTVANKLNFKNICG